MGIFRRSRKPLVAEKDRTFCGDRERSLVHRFDNDPVDALHPGERKNLIAHRPTYDQRVDFAAADRLQGLLGFSEPNALFLDGGKQLRP